jgi:tripartite-type tricarboxylate transporter receptor subunit TctC
MSFLAHIGFMVAWAAASSCTALAVAAETYPSRPIRLILPFPAGGPTDIVARLFGQKLGEALGQTVVIDNRGGASGAIAYELAARAAPDGHTLLLGTGSTLTINPNLFPKLPYYPLRDFRPVSRLAATPYILAVHPSVPARSVTELVALAKAKPGQLNFASGGVGSFPHISAELFRISAGLDMVHVPYRGTGPAIIDLVAGQVQLMFMNLLPAMPQVRVGKLRGLAVTSAQRSPAAPELPTIAESGIPGYETTGWNGIIVPVGTSNAIVRRLHAELAKIARQQDVRDRLTREGTDVIGSTPEEFAAHIKQETEKWAKIIKAAGIKVD